MYKRMRVVIYITLLLFFQTQGDNIGHLNNEQCSYLIYKYKYISNAIFQYVPTTIINQTTLNIYADVDYYQSKSPCNQSFIQLHNLIVNPYDNTSIHTVTKQLEKSLLEIFLQTINILQNSTRDVIFSVDYKNTTNQYRRIKTSRINTGRFIGTAIFANYLFNKLFSPTKTTCENIINLTEQKLENSLCQSTTASLLIINRQINFDRQIDSQSVHLPHENLNLIPLQRKTKEDFDRLLKQICYENSQYQLTDIINNELDDENLNRILLSNTSQYSNCEWEIINRNIVKVTRPSATEYILKTFSHDPSVIEYHFDFIEQQPNNHLKELFKTYLNNSCQISNFITLRMLIFIAEDNLTMKCVLNENNHWKYRTIAWRTLNHSTNFHRQFRIILDNEYESPEIRILAFENLFSVLNSSEILHLIETVQSNQLRFYIKSFFQQSSIWLANSGLYQFPFGKINVIFNENSSSLIPSIIQFQLANNTEIDLYYTLNADILVIFGRKSVIRFSTMKDFFQWLKTDRSFEIETLDGFYLKINLNFVIDPFKNLFRKSTAGILLRIQHGLGDILTGYEINFNLQSNFQININQSERSTSYIWRSIQKENILFKIEQLINPFLGHKQLFSKTNSSSSNKDFCYLIPHFDSKICLSFLFEHLWPSSIAIRLLSDDPSLIYNFTTSTHSLLFNNQQNEQIFRSYRFLRRYNEQSFIPDYLEFSTPTMNYTSLIHWDNQSLISFHLFKNNRSIFNSSGVYVGDLASRLSINLTDIHPNHIGKIFIQYNGNLTISAPKFLGGEFIVQIDRFSNWKQAQIRIEAERIFFFFKQRFLANFSYDLNRLTWNFTLTRNQNDRFQWILMKTKSHLNHLLIINTSLMEINHRTEGYYLNCSNMGIQSLLLINGWSMWNISAVIDNMKQIQIRLNHLFINAQVDTRTIEFEVNYFNQRLVQIYSHFNQSNCIHILIDIPGYRYESEGKLSAVYTNFSLDFPIIENHSRTSKIHLEFSSLSHHLLFNFTSNFRKQYFFMSLLNFTFNHYYLSQATIQSSLKIIHYQLFSFHSSAEYLANSTILQSFNGSFTLPSVFVSKPFLFHYEKHSQFFLQLFEWANLTHRSISSNISTSFGCHLFLINDLPRRISLTIEQAILGKRYLFIIEIDRHWMISLILNKKIRFELISSPIDSLILIKRIDLLTNQITQLPIKYSTNNQTLIRIEILFSKYFSTLINDLILDLSLNNQTLKFFCYLPLFKREFFALTWQRYFEKDFFHFHGRMETRFLRKRRLIDYEYNWNLASLHFWTFNSRFILFSFDPIQWNCNLTNNYLWNGQWAIDIRLMYGYHRELIRFNHRYSFTTIVSNLFFNLYLINSYYDLNLNYYHFNQSIEGVFWKNKYQHQINGYWNRTENSLQLNTQDMKSMTRITSTFVRTIVERVEQKIGILVERTTEYFRNDTQILECNPYLIIQSAPRLFLLQYYTLNDGLTTMMFEWSTCSYLSWNYTGHNRIVFPLSKFEIDIRRKYIFRIHTSTFKYSSIYNPKNRQLTIRREPLSDDADDRFVLKMNSYPNQTFFIHLQVINNHYELIAHPSEENSVWQFHGYLQQDRFNGSLVISNSDWLLSAKLNFNSSFYISTGRYVQFIPTSDSQIALEILFKSRIYMAFQYSGLRSLIALKFHHHSSNWYLYFSSKSINKRQFYLNFQLNNRINQSWILEIDEKRFSLVDHNSEFIFNGSLQDFSFRHLIGDRKNEFIINENTIGFFSNKFQLILSNLSSDTTRYFHISHQPSKQNLTIHYYKSGRFFRDNFNIQTPIYDINIIYYPMEDENRSVKIFFELLPLQMSSFSLVRGRTFRLGYETKEKQCILAGNLAFGLEDIDSNDVLIMKERWKFIYGTDKSEKIFLKWNLKLDLNEKSLQGQVNIQDPNDDMSKSVYSNITAYLKDMIFMTNIHTIYSSAEQPIVLQFNIDQRLVNQQYMSLKLIHKPSKTNLSFTIDHYPQRRFLLRLKPNNSPNEQILLHLYANTTESQLKLLLILANQIHFNLTLPKSYPETGRLHSALFIDNEEYFDGRFDTTALKFRTKEYLCNISLSELILQKRFDQKLLASIFARWLERNSSTALITIFNQADFQRISIPAWQSAQQNTWLQRLKEFLFDNNLTSEFSGDLKEFFNYSIADFINEHGQFGVQFIDHLKLDRDLQTGLQRMNSTTRILIENLFQISLFTEKFFQEYLNNLTCLIHHQNLIHLDISQLTTLTINSFVYQIVQYVNKILIIFNHFTHYSRSMNALITYISNEVILNTYRFLSDFYLETKNYFLRTFIQYTYEMDFLLKISPLLSDSITYFSSNDIRTIMYLLNDRLRRLLSIWIDSPLEYKLMKTIASQLIAFIDRFRFYLDDKLDFLLPTLKICTPRLWINNSINQTFLLTWSKQYNLTNVIDEE